MKQPQVCTLTVDEERSFLDSFREIGSQPCANACSFLQQFEPYLARLCRSLAREPDIQADLYHEGVMAAFQALASFTPDLGVRLAMHVMNHIRWRMLKWRRAERLRALCFDGEVNPRMESTDALCSVVEEDGAEVRVRAFEVQGTGYGCCPRGNADRALAGDAVACALVQLTQKQRAAVHSALARMRREVFPERVWDRRSGGDENRSRNRWPQ